MKVQDTVKIDGEFYPNERDMTPEEIEATERMNFEISNSKPSPEERISIMEDAFAELCEVIFNG